MRNLFVLYFIVLNSSFLISQTKEEVFNERFDSVFLDTASRVLYEDIDKALEISDSLFLNSQIEEHKIKSLMLATMAYRNKGDLKSLFRTAFKAEEIADRSKNHEWKIRILGFVTSELRELGLNKEKNLVLERMKDNIAKVKDENQRNLLFSMYYQEKTFDFFGNYDKNYVWENLELSEKYLNKIPEGTDKTYLKGINQWIYGHTLLSLKENPDEALEHTENAEELFAKANRPDYLKSILQLNKGRAHFLKNQDALAFDYFIKAEELSETVENVVPRMLVYNELHAFYLSKNDTVNSYNYLVKYNRLKDRLISEKVNPIEVLFEDIENRKRKLKSQNLILVLLTISALIVLIAYLIGSLYYNKKTKGKIKNLLEQIDEGNVVTLDREEESTQKADFKNSINNETYQKIIDGLEAFKASKRFLQPNLTIADVCSEINVNSKYLSAYLNQELNKDFNKYINECRINYVVDKLYNEEKYRLYKLSVIAKECGFSSHSKFSSVFKVVTGVSPSNYIKYLDKER